MVTDSGCSNKARESFPKNFTITPGQRQYPNPGCVSNLHKKTRDIMPTVFDGIQIGYKRGLALNKTLLTSWVLSQTYPAGFRIGGIYNWKCTGNILETPTIEADINPSTLSSNFSILYYPLSCIRFEAKFQRLEKSNIAENLISIEHIGQCGTFAINAYNIKQNSGRMTLSYLRSVTEHFSLGTELFLEWFNRDMKANTAVAARYGKDKYALAATISSEALDVSYWRLVHKSIQMGTSLVFNQRTEKAIGSICYQWEFKDAFVRGMIDSDWSVGFMYNRCLSQLPCSIGLSLLFCIPNNRFAFGFILDSDPTLKLHRK